MPTEQQPIFNPPSHFLCTFDYSAFATNGVKLILTY